jgi:hypothetical protein
MHPMAAAKRERGRPPKLARLKRTQKLQLWLTQTEHKALNKYAQQRNMTASEVIRGCLRPVLEQGGGEA